MGLEKKKNITFLFKQLKALMKDNCIKYYHHRGGITIYDCEYFPDLHIVFEDDRVNIATRGFDGHTYNFEAHTIYFFLNKLVKFDLITTEEIRNLYIRGISGPYDRANPEPLPRPRHNITIQRRFGKVKKRGILIDGKFVDAVY